MRIKLTILLAMLIVLLTSCGRQPALQAGRPEGATPVPLPQGDKTTVTGKVVDDSGEVLANMGVRLAEVVRQGGEGAYILDAAFSPGGFTDENGYFTIADIPPMEYVVVVGDVFGEYVVIPDASGKARTWETKAGQVLDVGTLEVDLEPVPAP